MVHYSTTDFVWQDTWAILHSLQSTNIVMFNGYLSFFKYIDHLLNTSSTDPPLFLYWLTGHICLCHLSTFVSLCWARCHNFKVRGASNLVSWFLFPLIPDSVSTSSSPTQVPIYCPNVLQDFLGFAPFGLSSTPNPSCAIPHRHLSTVASHPILIHAIFSYGLLPGHIFHSTHAATTSIVTPTPFTSTQ